jgi:diguanylate cyclase (GGDEF)-like protein
MKTPSTSIQELVARARRRLNCFAVAFVAPEQHLFHFDIAGEADQVQSEAAEYAEKMLRRGADSFMTMCRDQREPIIRNRVRDAGSSPLLCRFIIVPVLDDLEMLAGVFVMYNPANGVEFNAVDAAMAGRLSKVFGKTLSLPRDPLTKLLTRAGFERQVEMLRPGQSSGSGVLLYTDIDQLHVVNDLFGFEIGDRVIAAVGQKLHGLTLSNEGVISRMSGDRFTVFLPNQTLERGRTVAARMRDSIATMRFTTNNQPVQITLSLGVALLGVDSTLDHGLAAAEIACKAAKDRGRNRAEVYQEADHSIIRRHDDMLIVGRLRTALEEDRIQIFGQAITSLQKGSSTRRYEMLVRLVDEDDKLVMPQEFMSSATRYQLLPKLDRHVISHVLAKIKAASVMPGFKPLQVSLNLSGPTISEPDFADWLIEQVQGCGVPSDWIGFELTENAAIANLVQAQTLMERMSVMGCKFALDDFGTGVNSLAYLKALKLSMIKIDGSFIRDVLENERSESLVRGIAQLAKSMGIETVAEYVETPTICMRLIDLGVQYGQGYALEKPVLLDRILDPVRSLALAS